MAASSATGTGTGSADRNSPPTVKQQRLVAVGPRILLAGIATMTGGEVDVTHPSVENWSRTLPMVTSYSQYPVWVEFHGDEFFTVRSLETGVDFSFGWMVIETGISPEVETG